MGKKALLVLENPWWEPKENPKRASVLPYLQGLEKLKDNFNIYYSTFYEKKGLGKALKEDLTKTKEKRLFLYVASHGESAKRLSCMNLSSLLNAINKVARIKNIEGVIIGSCNIGDSPKDFCEAIKSSKIVWIFGYKCEIDWLTSTLIDISIYDKLMDIRGRELSNKDIILRYFKRALKKFNGNFLIDDEKKIPLKNAITLVVQPYGQGKTPQDITSELVRELKWL